MSVHKDQPAFPATEEHGCNVGWSGMSLRQYAAIKLKVADSGVDWLDEMIIKSKRDDFAAKAMQAHIVGRGEFADSHKQTIAECSYEMADAMPIAREA